MPTYDIGSAKPAEKVPKGGTSCANCKWLRDNACINKYYIEHTGSGKIPAPLDEFCSIWWEVRDDEATPENIREKFARALDRKKL